MNADIIRQGELVGRDIMLYETTEVVGAVDHVLVAIKQSAVVGLSYKTPGLIGKKHALSWQSITNIGTDCVVAHSARSDASATGEPSATNPEIAAAQSITNLEVWTDGGEHIGHVVDVCFERTTGKIQQYLLLLKSEADKAPAEANSYLAEDEPTAALFGEEADEQEAEKQDNIGATNALMLLPEAIISAGQKRMMIAEEEVQNLHPYDQAIDLTSTLPGGRPADWLGEQLPAMPTDVNALLQKGQAFAGKVTEKVKQRAQQLNDQPLGQPSAASDTLPDITEQLQEKTEQVREQMHHQLRRAQEKAAEQLRKSQLEEKLGGTSLGRSLGKTLNRFTRSQTKADPADKDPIDIASFEVWEDD
ncbi:MAG: hypothetical protein AAFQ74_08255 [Cyanobacteria bacterium J06623_4]